MSPICPISLERKLEQISLIIYGIYGCGKSHLAGTAPRPLYLDFEGGVGTLTNLTCEACGRRYWLDRDGGCDKCSDLGGDVFQVTDAASLKLALEAAEVIYKVRDLDEEKKKKAEEWLISRFGEVVSLNTKTIVIDTLSRMQEYEVIGILDSRDNKRSETEDVMEMREWGVLLTRMYRLMKILPNQGFNIIMLCQAREFEDPHTKRRKWLPNLRGQFGDQVGAYCDLVGYLEIRDEMVGPGQRKTIRRLHFQPSGDFVAKSRYSQVPSYLDNPTFAQIQEAVLAARK